MRLRPQGGGQEKGGWETAVLALYSVLPTCPAEDQGTEEGLRLLQLLIPERERPPLQTSPSSPPPPTQTQQLSSQTEWEFES